MAKTNKQAEALSGTNLFIVLALITLLAVGITVLVSKTLITNIVRNTKVVSAEKKANDQLDKDLTNAPLLVSAFKQMGNESTTLANALPVTPDLPSLIVAFENMASDSGVFLKTLAPSLATSSSGEASTAAPAATEGTDATPETYLFSTTFDGTYDAVQRLLKDIETSGRPMRVTGLQFNGSGSAMSGQLDMETYYQAKAALPFSKETIK